VTCELGALEVMGEGDGGGGWGRGEEVKGTF